MGTEVLRSHDFLRSPFPRPERVHRGFPARAGRRNRRDCARGVVAPMKAPTDHLVIGQVTILKRGEVLPKKLFSSAPCSQDNAEKKKAVKASLGSTGGRRKQSKEATGCRPRLKVVADEEPALCSTGRLGPEPDLVPKQVRMSDPKPADVSFGGSVSVTSPSPSDLPVPFFISTHRAAEDLRRLLKI